MSLHRSRTASIPAEDRPLLNSAVPTYVRAEYTIPLRRYSADTTIPIDPPEAFASNQTRGQTNNSTAIWLTRFVNNCFKRAEPAYTHLLYKQNLTLCTVNVIISFVILTFLISSATLIILVFHVFRGVGF